MNFETYKTACHAFAKDSATWIYLDDFANYTATATGGWAETIEEATASVRWAFHLSGAEVEKEAERHFAKYLINCFTELYETATTVKEWRETMERLFALD